MEAIPQTAIEIHPEILRKHRKTVRESQDRFWARFGVTQSRGSRFEKGAEIPPPVAILLGLYFNGVVTDRDLKQAQLQCP
jgi:predicted transcriptional regulator